MWGFTLVDIIIIGVLLYNTYRGYVLGFLPLMSRLFTFIISIAGAFWLYQYAGRFIAARFEVFPSLAYGIGFIAVLFLFQIIFTLIFNLIISFLPEEIREHSVSKYLGLIPGAIDGMIFIALSLFLITLLPISSNVKDAVTSSRIGGSMIASLSTAEVYINRTFGGVFDQALTALTTKPESGESVSLPFKPKTLSVHETAEARMLELVNAERVKAGVKPLTLDRTIIPVARAHSKDMWERQYFAHENPDGESPADRMTKGSVRFLTAGENLALAQTVELAHKGLMNSPGHKRNILDPDFSRIGIGVIDGGIYGKMFTQNFAD
jgi:uncharacterized protein YkwD